MSTMISRPVVAFLLLFALAATTRLAYVVFLHTYEDRSHGAELESAAIDLATHGELGNVYADDSGKSAHVAPLYPICLAGLYRTFGMPREQGRLPQQILALLVTSVCIALLPSLGQKAKFRPAAGLLAGVLLAISPANLWIETAGSWEQPYAALFLILLTFLFLHLHERQWQSTSLLALAGGGILLGLTALLSPNLLPAAFLMIFAEAIWQPCWRRRILLGSGILAVVSLLIVSPWIWRNYIVLGGFVPLRSNFGLELYDGNNALATGKTYVPSNHDHDNPMRLMHPIFGGAELAHLKDVGELRYMKEKQQRALEWIAENPAGFAWLTGERFRLFWFPPAEMWEPNNSGRAFKSLVFTLLGLGTFGGIVCLCWTGHPQRWLFAAAVLGPTLVYLITHVDTRYRYPVFALSALLTAEGVLTLEALVRRFVAAGFSLRWQRPQAEACGYGSERESVTSSTQMQTR